MAVGFPGQAMQGPTGANPYSDPKLFGGLGFPVQPTPEQQAALTRDFGVQFPSEFQQSPLFSNQMMRNRGIRALEAGIMGGAMTPGPTPGFVPESFGEGLSRAFQGIMGVPAARRQFRIAQIEAPLQLAEQMGGLAAMKGQQAVQAAEAQYLRRMPEVMEDRANIQAQARRDVADVQAQARMDVANAQNLARQQIADNANATKLQALQETFQAKMDLFAQNNAARYSYMTTKAMLDAQNSKDPFVSMREAFSREKKRHGEDPNLTTDEILGLWQQMNNQGMFVGKAGQTAVKASLAALDEQGKSIEKQIEQYQKSPAGQMESLMPKKPGAPPTQLEQLQSKLAEIDTAKSYIATQSPSQFAETTRSAIKAVSPQAQAMQNTVQSLSSEDQKALQDFMSKYQK